MFKLTAKAKNWKAVTSALALMNDEAVLTISKDGIDCFTMDPSHTEAMGFSWARENFTEFEIDFEGEEKNLNLSLKGVTAAFKRFGNDVDVTLSDEGPALLVSNGAKKFTCSLLEDGVAETRRPKIPYVNSFDLKISKLEEMMDDCKVFGIENIFFENINGKLMYSGEDPEGNVSGTMVEEYTLPQELLGFNYTFMEPILKSLKAYSNSDAKIELFEKAPIRLSFEIPDVLTIQYYLAPLSE